MLINVEGANGPIDEQAEKIINEKKIEIIPDVSEQIREVLL